MQKRNPLVVAGLSIITLGIYDLYWLAVTKNELNKQNTGDKVPSIWLLLAPIPLLVIGFIVDIVGAAKSPGIGTYNSFSATAQSNVHVSGLAVVGLLILIVGGLGMFVISLVWFFKYSKAVNEYTKGKMTTAVSFLLLFLVHIIGVALIQDAFNDVISAPAQPYQPAPVGPPMPVNPMQEAANQPVYPQPTYPQQAAPQIPVMPPAPQAPMTPPVTPVENNNQDNNGPVIG